MHVYLHIISLSINILVVSPVGYGNAIELILNLKFNNCDVATPLLNGDKNFPGKIFIARVIIF